jgi:Chaperone of endosialidase
MGILRQPQNPPVRRGEEPLPCQNWGAGTSPVTLNSVYPMEVCVVKTIREYLYPGATTRIIAHTMVWFDGYTHPVQKDRDPGYRSNNAEQVRAQCEQLKACQVDILMYNWYGPNNAFLNESTHNYFNVSPLGHMINIDGGGFHSRDELFSHMRYVRSNFLTHPNYERWRDKYIVTLFAKSGNDPEWFRALEQENPDCVFAYNSTSWGTSQYEWIDPNLEGGVDWFCRTFGDRSDGLFIPAFFPGFNDDNGQGQSVWSPLEPARIWPPGIGANQQTYEACFAAINQQYSTSHQLEYVQAITVNDYEEGSECEEKFFQPANTSEPADNQAWPSWSVRTAQNADNFLTFDFSGTTPRITASAPISVADPLALSSAQITGGQIQFGSPLASLTNTIQAGNGEIAGNFNITSGAYYSVSAGGWVATLASAILVGLNAGAFTLFANGGLTVGANYFPAQVFNVSPAGVVSLNSGGKNFSITPNGTGGNPTFNSSTGVLNSNCAVTVTSDYRVKKNVEMLDAALPLLIRLRPVSFDYVDSFASDGKRHLGFLAHELQAVLPGSVVGEKDALTDDGENQLQSVHLWDLVAVLTRAVQELSEKVDQLCPQPKKGSGKVAST